MEDFELDDLEQAADLDTDSSSTAPELANASASATAEDETAGDDVAEHPPASAAPATSAAAGPDEGTDDAHDSAGPAPTVHDLMARDQAGRFTKGGKKVTPAPLRREQIQNEIKDLTTQKYNTRREVDEARRELETLRRELAANGGKPADAAPAGSTTAATPDSADARPRWKAFDEQGKTYEEYEDAVVAWEERRESRLLSAAKGDVKAEAERLAEDRRRAEVQNRLDQDYEERLTATRAKYDDFDEVIEANLADVETTPFVRDLVYLHEQGPDIIYHLAQNREEAIALSQLPLTNSMMAAVRSTSKPVEFLSYLAKHPAETERLARLAPSIALVALGRLTQRLEGAPLGSSPSVASISKAAPPPSHKGGSRSGGGARSDVDLPLDDYITKREKDERRARLSA